jgi:hypothetical protein
MNNDYVFSIIDRVFNDTNSWDMFGE